MSTPLFTASEAAGFRSFTVVDGEALVLRAPTPYPIRTAFGTMHDRPAVLVRIADDAGTVGWGEVWCNFPSVGAEHRARLLNSILLPLLKGKTVENPEAIFAELSSRTRLLALQSGETGPFAQAIAGVDIALWDIAARRLEKPLWKVLGGEGAPRVPAYASGINPEAPERVMEAQRARGFTAFKLKIGFGREIDLENAARVRALIGPDTPFMVDANQAWDLDEAIEMSRALEPFAPQWLEEPLAADRPLAEWQTLAQKTAIPLAAGENLRGLSSFDRMAQSSAVRVIQPDLAKWGGISGCLRAAERILMAGKRYCPHFLGAGVGLLASAHLLKAAGGDGMLEVDVNDNPLQRELLRAFPEIADGSVTLPSDPGLGIAPHEETIARYRTLS